MEPEDREMVEALVTAGIVIGLGVGLVAAVWYIGRKAEKSLDRTLSEGLYLVASN